MIVRYKVHIFYKNVNKKKEFTRNVGLLDNIKRENNKLRVIPNIRTMMRVHIEYLHILIN